MLEGPGGPYGVGRCWLPVYRTGMKDHLREKPREPARLDSLKLYEEIRPTSGTQFVTESLLDEAASIFVTNVSEVARQASTLHGWRVQNLFRGVVVSLDRVRLIKDEDEGRLFFKGQDMKQPDFRIVTDAGKTFLVEVKNKAPSRPTSDFTMSHKELDGLRRYCQLSPGSETKLAIYWAGWNRWTLTDPRWFTKDGPRARLSLEQAMRANEMVTLGDVILATEMPLSLRIIADKERPHTIADDGSCSFTIGQVEILVAGNPIERKEERRLAYTLLVFGGWSDIDTSVDTDDRELNSITVTAQPEVPVRGQAFQLHSPLSSLFSSYFGLATISAGGHVRRLDTAYRSGGMGSLVDDSYDGDVLKLWRFKVEPTVSSG